MNLDDPIAFVDKVASELGEHFEHVQILVSWNDGGFTKNIQRGCGNWWARQGLAQNFIQKDIAQENAEELSKALEPPPDDEWKKPVG